MKNNLIIAGIILIIIGIVLFAEGYNKMQPTKTEKTIGLLSNLSEELTGEEIEGFPKRNKSQQIVMITIGSLSFFIGLTMILKSGKKITS